MPRKPRPAPEAMVDSDLEIHAWPPRPTGGQQVADHRTGVLVVHRPTGIAVVVDSERSRLTNRAEAVKRLREVLTLMDPGDPEWAEIWKE